MRIENRASFSSTGLDVELAAPGVSINSTLKGGGYGTMSGTSMASPHVAGVAALVIASGITDANNDHYVNDEVRQKLTATADDLGAAGRDAWYGFGLVNAANAAPVSSGNRAPVADAGPDQGVSTGSIVYLDGRGSYDPDGSSITYKWKIVSMPTESTASLNDVTAVQPTFFADLAGTYMVELTVSDGLLSSAPDSVVITAAPANQAIAVSVSSITYATSGGKDGNKHLQVTVALVDNLGAPVAGASVSITLTNNDTGRTWDSTGTTGTNGSVTFTLSNAPSGTYKTQVKGVTAAGLTWDGLTPPNSFDK